MMPVFVSVSMCLCVCVCVCACASACVCVCECVSALLACYTFINYWIRVLITSHVSNYCPHTQAQYIHTTMYWYSRYTFNNVCVCARVCVSSLSICMYVCLCAHVSICLSDISFYVSIILIII